MIVFIPEEIVKKYLGIPYKHLGRTMEGLDCWGLVCKVYADKGVEVFDVDNYEREWARRGENYFVENYSKNWDRVACYGPGDVVLLKHPKDSVGHSGIFLDRGRFIHATRNGVVVSRLKDWEKKVYGFYRWKRLRDDS